MSSPQSSVFRVRVWGPLACFTRPEMKVERVSYECMTPSAARGVLESVLWKPAISWRVHCIQVLKPIAWTSFRRNEVNSIASPRAEAYFADEDRAQRNTVALRDVDYLISASFRLTDRAGAQDNIRKFEEMFARRLARGQHHQQAFLGCREFAANVEPAPQDDPPSLDDADRPLGLLFYDFDYRTTPPVPRFFDARLNRCVLRVPPWEEIIGAAPLGSQP